ncbi:uncharacterized protein TM35_001421000, partial [Trypanosoma theileri]
AAVMMYAFNGTHDTLTLTEQEMQYVYHVHKKEVSFESKATKAMVSCPNRYIFVNTHTYGRHHNQLQEFMNIIMWAALLNRTAVLGWFRIGKKWMDPAELYDFSTVAQRYCVVTTDVMHQQLNRTGLLGGGSYACYGQCVRDTPLRHLSRHLRLLKQSPRLPPYFSWMDHESVMRRVVPLIRAAHADLVVLGGAYAFFLRRGLVHHAAIYALLRPSLRVQQRVDAFLRHSFTTRSRFFAVHVRHRELMCNKEMDVHLPALRRYTEMRPEEEQQLRAQCNISIPYLAALHASLGLQLFAFPLFVAHDSQDLYTVQLLAAHGARLYDKEHYAQFEDCAEGLCALAVDYFLLTKGEYFSGNALSSVSQNVCFARLGRGMACHGMGPALIRMLSRDAQDI